MNVMLLRFTIYLDTSTSFIHLQISAKTIIYVMASNMWD